MSQTWFTADTHFGHNNIIKYCQRPFLNEEEKRLCSTDPRGPWRISAATAHRHDRSLLDAINSRVSRNDTLWILGDFCWGDLRKARHYREQIHCANVHLVWGNHDNREIAEVFQRTLEQGMIKVKHQRIWLNHYPMRSWDRRFHGSWHLYGHVHGRLAEEDRQVSSLLVRDVGVDACDYKPISFDELADYMSPRVRAFEEEKEKFLRGESSHSVD